MVLSPQGLYVPDLEHCSNCGACAAVCPACADDIVDLDNSLGSSVATLVGYSRLDEERQRSSSGGLATRVLKSLIERDDVDAAVVATASRSGTALFEAAVVTTPDEIQNAAGSKYYPIEFSGALRELRASGQRFAVIGVPCVITALRRGMQRYPWLRDQCKCLIALACGHLVSTHYTTFLAAASGVAPRDLREVVYRRGTGTRGAGDFKFVATRADGTTGEELPFSSGGGIPGAVWTARLFTPGACFRCADLFGVDADLSLMDAWLPEYLEERDGTSLAVVRSQHMQELLEAERTAARVHLEPIAPERVIKSQAGAMANRTVAAAVRRLEAGGERLPLREGVRFRWQRMRSDLSNRLFSGGPLRQAVGVRLVLTWIGAYRGGLRLRSVASRLSRPLRAFLARGGER
ncbi:MAG: hypothetical protein GX131_07285 [candidate division WS1 bacterium]|jgi:coenzyme F420-reducing hydrogenase beta subunit|nr:hypothetical protein [candidate division WS1 bacterium]